MVHPFTRPKQPGGGTAAAAAQRPVRQRSPQQPGGGGGELEMQLTSKTPYLFIYLNKRFIVNSLILVRRKMFLFLFSCVFLQRKSVLNPEAKEFVPGKKY